tara:strand:+ start:171 stop:410 length:240 start_codon:yes stop_codon:yes gene_type:complete
LDLEDPQGLQLHHLIPVMMAGIVLLELHLIHIMLLEKVVVVEAVIRTTQVKLVDLVVEVNTQVVHLQQNNQLQTQENLG